MTMQFDQGAIVALLIFAAGVCVNAGATLQMLRSHDRRIDKQETMCGKCNRTVVQLATKEGLPL